MRDFDQRLLSAPGRAFELSVVEVHRHALVAEVTGPAPGAPFSARDPGCRRVVLLHPARTLVPLGMRLESAEDWSVLPKSAGAPIWLRGRTLSALSCAAFELEGAGVDLRARPAQGDRPRALLRERLSWLRAQPDGTARSGDPLCRALDARLSAFAARVAAGNFGTGEGLLQPLVGLGHGSTPSGDDMIAGALAALWALGTGDLAAARQAIASEIAALAPGQTTQTSLDMLWNAARGYFPAALRDVAEALCHAPVSQREFTAIEAALLRLGATSGRDMLQGVAALLTAVAGDGR